MNITVHLRSTTCVGYTLYSILLPLFLMELERLTRLNNARFPPAFVRSLVPFPPPLLHREPSAECFLRHPHPLPPRPPLRDLGLPLLEPLLPAWPHNPDTLRGLPPLWPRPHSGRYPAPALIAPTAYARTPPCPPGSAWADPTDPRLPPPTSATSLMCGTLWSPPSEPDLARSPSEMRRRAWSGPARRRLGRAQPAPPLMPAPSPWPRRNTPPFSTRYRREPPPSTANTPTSRVASATT